MDQKIKALINAAALLREDNLSAAKDVIASDYPFIPIKAEGRNYTILEMVQQFFRDGFIDRYSGTQMINPGMLRIMSELMPDVFPYHPHGKTDACHMAFWDFLPSVDHIYPISLGGKDDPDNWATTSMAHNSAKSVFTLEQIGWTLKDPGDISLWDGLSADFIALVDMHPHLKQIGRVKQYYDATKAVMLQMGLLNEGMK